MTKKEEIKDYYHRQKAEWQDKMDCAFQDWFKTLRGKKDGCNN